MDAAEGEYDYIVVGAGSAGSVMAERLSENPDRRVLLLEEGPHDSGFLIKMPKGFGKLLTDPQHASFYPTTHDRGDGTPEIWVRGKVLGGSSSVNGMVWVRGQPQDYDGFAAAGNNGWSWADVAPYFRKLENHGLGADELRGNGGPVEINTHPKISPLTEAFIAAGQSMGLKRKQDQNRLDQEGIGYLQLNIDRRGRRVSASHAFLHPAIKRPNLSVVTGVRADRVLFDGHRAIGVIAFVNGHTKTYRCNGEVILCAGALASPKILQLSGIGPAEALQSLGINVLHDAPGVGANMREHWLLALQFRLRHWRDSQNRDYSGIGLAKNLVRYLLTGGGPLSWGSYEAAAFVRALPRATRPDSQLMFAPFSLNRATYSFESEPGMQLFGYPLRPQSRGSLLIQSADPVQPLRIDPNYLADEGDRAISVAMIRKIRELVAQPAMQAYVSAETSPTAEAQTDEQILDCFRRYGQSAYHAVGTCRMGQDANAVVDERLRVRGAERLRVMDCSILPELISGNTHAPIMAMSWRAADLIIQDAAR